MDINDTVKENSYEDDWNGFPNLYIERGWAWKLLITPYITTKKYNWKCKACGVKIHDDVQVITQESHNPSYHVSCWRVLYERALEGIIRYNENMFRQIEGVELTPCQNVIDVQNEQ